jgi:hypothetical protein
LATSAKQAFQIIVMKLIFTKRGFAALLLGQKEGWAAVPSPASHGGEMKVDL